MTAFTSITSHEHIGFELGWDYAHYRWPPPAPYAQQCSPLRDGLLAGQAAFGARTLVATRHVRKWLQLRLHAWLRGRSVELFQVTPHYLAQLEVSHCPITRQALSSATQGAGDARVVRVRNDAGYAAGNLALISTQASHAKAAHGYRAALRLADAAQATPHSMPGGPDAEGLDPEQWARVAALCSFVEPLPHDEACGLPLLLLPPNRLRLFNPVQALQAFVSSQLLIPGWSRRVRRFEELLPGKPLQQDFNRFFIALLPRVLEAGKPAGPRQARWAVEDAWRNPLVQERWAGFARQLSAAECETLVHKAAANRLATGCVQRFSDTQATEGWNLATRGYVPHARLRATRVRDDSQRELAL